MYCRIYTRIIQISRVIEICNYRWVPSQGSTSRSNVVRAEVEYFVYAEVVMSSTVLISRQKSAAIVG